MFDWLKNAHPGVQIALLLVAVFTAGGATTLSTVNALSMPRQNATAIAQIDSTLSTAHPSFEERLARLESAQEDLAERLEAQLCLSVAERDDTIPWQSCISADLLRGFRGNN